MREKRNTQQKRKIRSIRVHFMFKKQKTRVRMVQKTIVFGEDDLTMAEAETKAGHTHLLPRPGPLYLVL